MKAIKLRRSIYNMKKLLGIAMLIILAIGVTGCGGSSNDTEEYEPQNKQEQQEKKVADRFLKKIKKEDYDDLKSCVYLPEGALITDEDIKWLIPRSDFSDLIGNKMEVVLTEIGDANVTLNEDDNIDPSCYTLKYVGENEAEYDVIVIQDKKNDWYVYLDGLYSTDFTCYVKKGAILYLNDMEVPMDYITDDEDKDYDEYTIPYVPNREFKLRADKGGEIAVTPNSTDVTIE